MPTFLHTGDVHLDSAFSARLDARGAELRRGEVMRCFAGIVDLAADVDVLLIAGDLFDKPNPSADTVSFVKRKFAEIPKTRVFIAAGNHDPYCFNSVYDKVDFGENVHVFKTSAECITLDDLKLRVWGVSFESQNPGCISLPAIKKDDDYGDILLVHGDLFMPDSVYNPISRDYLKGCGFDYVALGHVHKRSEVEKIGNTNYAYCGICEGRGFDECGDMGCYMGNIENGYVSASFKSTCIRRMHRLNVDVSAAEDLNHISEIIKKAITDTGNKNDMYKIILSGNCGERITNTDYIKDSLSDLCYYIQIKDETKQNFDTDKIKQENSLRGEFLRILDEYAKKDPSILSQKEKAAEIGLWALSGGDDL